MKDLSEKLGKRIRHFRMSSRMSQGELAIASKLTNGYLSDVERGKVNISISNLDLIAESLNVPLSVLLDCDTSCNKEEMLLAIQQKMRDIPDDALEALYRIVLMMGQKNGAGEVSAVEIMR